ncbi:exonuclease domain-containing protein [Methanosphaera sp. ISO3-F5]|uniref:exonuclease domain-containing protein n=1 Tax=Methanosphaera sp. ISO3-F5 TaxID=1452353 RepID=UPI002B25CCF5|nr:exonuclease domain-containing protein [Methanosphaera sp. ISO3-F5]WQH65042.1 exonuclease domain-containing protein [Methanosphaera sp. ISO3-F5]
MKNYAVLDIENPNFRQNSICAIGIILVKNNQIIKKEYSLINPEDTFDRINIDITKITPQRVKKSPTLPDYWPKIKNLLINNIVIGHNVIYDLRVLSKSLQRYNIPIPDFDYICTLSLSRKNLKLSSYKLENIAKELHIKYNPHIAIEDARAAQELFEYINKQNQISSKQVNHYHFVPKVHEKYDPKLSTNINNLYGMIRVILFEEYITEPQFALFEEWYINNKKYNQYLIFHKISLVLKTIIEKGYIEGSDKKELVNIVDFVPISSIYSKKTLKNQVLQGIIKTITADNKVTIEELTHLKEWLLRNNSLKGTYPYDKILIITETILTKAVIDFNQQEKLADTFKDLITPIKNTNETFELKSKNFSLSGEFNYGNKEDIIKILEKYGCTYKSSISNKVDYLFVGDLGSPAWKYGNMGGKIVKAQKLQDQGGKIKIISEKNLFNNLKNI